MPGGELLFLDVYEDSAMYKSGKGNQLRQYMMHARKRTSFRTQIIVAAEKAEASLIS